MYITTPDNSYLHLELIWPLVVVRRGGRGRSFAKDGGVVEDTWWRKMRSRLVAAMRREIGRAGLLKRF